MWWHTRRNQISSFAETDESIQIGRGCQFSRLLAAEVCASLIVMLDTPRSEVVWQYWLPTPFVSFPYTSSPVRHRLPSGFKRTLLKCSHVVIVFTRTRLKCISVSFPFLYELIFPSFAYLCFLPAGVQCMEIPLLSFLLPDVNTLLMLIFCVKFITALCHASCSPS